MFDVIKFIEDFMDVELLEYQKVLIKEVANAPSNYVYVPHRHIDLMLKGLKGGGVNGESMRRYYGDGKISKCNYMDEFPQGR